MKLMSLMMLKYPLCKATVVFNTVARSLGEKLRTEWASHPLQPVPLYRDPLTRVLKRSLDCC